LVRYVHIQSCLLIGKHGALSREVTCNFRLYLEIETSVKPHRKPWNSTSNYSCPQTKVPYTTAYGCDRPNVKTQCLLFTYSSSWCLHFRLKEKFSNIVSNFI